MRLILRYLVVLKRSPYNEISYSKLKIAQKFYSLLPQQLSYHQPVVLNCVHVYPVISHKGVDQWFGRGGMGAIAPHFCQDGARDVLKIDEKIGGGRVVVNLQ